MSGTPAKDMIRGLLALDDPSVCAPPHIWTDCDTDDFYEAAGSKDGEWMTITRVSHLRGEVVTFCVPREALAHVVRQFGGKLDA